MQRWRLAKSTDEGDEDDEDDEEEAGEDKDDQGDTRLWNNAGQGSVGSGCVCPRAFLAISFSQLRSLQGGPGAP